jgi:hypothetical protein
VIIQQYGPGGIVFRTEVAQELLGGGGVGPPVFQPPPVTVDDLPIPCFGFRVEVANEKVFLVSAENVRHLILIVTDASSRGNTLPQARPCKKGFYRRNSCPFTLLQARIKRRGDSFR